MVMSNDILVMSNDILVMINDILVMSNDILVMSIGYDTSQRNNTRNGQHTSQDISVGFKSNRIRPHISPYSWY